MTWMALQPPAGRGGVDPSPPMPVLPAAPTPPGLPVTVHPSLPVPATGAVQPVGDPAFDAGNRYLRMLGAQPVNTEDGPTLRIQRNGAEGVFRWDGARWTWQNGATDGFRNWVPAHTVKYADQVPPKTEPQHQFIDAVATRLAGLVGTGSTANITETTRVTASYEMFHRYMSAHATVSGTFQGENVYCVVHDRNTLRVRWNSNSGGIEYSRSQSDFLPNFNGGLPESSWKALATPRPVGDSGASVAPLWDLVDKLRTIHPTTGAVPESAFTRIQNEIDRSQALVTAMSMLGAESRFGERRAWRFPGTQLLIGRRDATGEFETSVNSGETWSPLTARSSAPYTAPPRGTLTAEQTAGNALVESLRSPLTGGTAPLAAVPLQVATLQRDLFRRAGAQPMTYISGSNEVFLQVGTATEIYFRPVQVEGRTEWQFSFEPPSGRQNTAARAATFRPLSEFAAHTAVVDRTGPEISEARALAASLLDLQRGVAGTDTQRSAALLAADRTIRALDNRADGARMILAQNGVAHPSTPLFRAAVTDYVETARDGTTTTVYRVSVPGADRTRVSDYRFNRSTNAWEWRNVLLEGPDGKPQHDDFVPCGQADPAFPGTGPFYNETDGNNRLRRAHNQLARTLAQLSARP